MDMRIYVSKPVFYGLLYAAIYGTLVLLLSFPAIYLMIRPHVDFMYAWKGVFDGTASGIICFNIIGFWHGWTRAKNSQS
ncbi:hypothetical protein [Duganella vulcania]|uniref:Uncharacterized protein n=1 Tax=Duganella vulcania TaxID=2692166 RepID=A0A845GG64_9BURK|nr:hypothetical protein [Duganella vulcania]MYM92392.1 hypothetical protein [Duganella vulcania]